MKFKVGDRFRDSRTSPVSDKMYWTVVGIKRNNYIYTSCNGYLEYEIDAAFLDTSYYAPVCDPNELLKEIL